MLLPSTLIKMIEFLTSVLGIQVSHSTFLTQYKGLSEEMYEDGFENITNIDFSSKVISLMEEKCKTRCPHMSCMNILVINVFSQANGRYGYVRI
jgi:hypothetical protein